MAISNVIPMCMTVIFIMKNFTSWFHVEVKPVSFFDHFRNISKGTITASNSITSPTSATSANDSTTTTTNTITCKCVELSLEYGNIVDSTTTTNTITCKCIELSLEYGNIICCNTEAKEVQIQSGCEMVIVNSHLGNSRLVRFHRSGDGVKHISDIDNIVW